MIMNKFEINIKIYNNSIIDKRKSDNDKFDNF